jgi:uncharacterized membrane protein YbhN (UPF0104 family)
VVLLTVSFKPKGAKKFMSFLIRLLSRVNGKRWDLTSLQTTMEKTVDNYHEGMRLLLENPRVFFKPMIFSFFAWGFEVVALLLVFASLGQTVPVDKVIIVRAIGKTWNRNSFRRIRSSNHCDLRCVQFRFGGLWRCSVD